MKQEQLGIDKLEDKVCLDAAPVYGPEIPADLPYVAPPALMRPEVEVPTELLPVIDLIEDTPVESLQHPLPEDGFIDRDYIWDEDLHAMFAAFASDGEITVREARDLVVSSDDGGYISRFEVFQTLNYIYSEDYNHLWNRQSQVFALLATSDYGSLLNDIGVDVDATYLTEGLHSVQPVADYWWSITRQAEV